MSETHDSSAPVGCLLCLIQASESMREEIFEGPFPSKMDAALDTIDRLLDDLVGLARAERSGAAFEVGVLTYQAGDDGKPRLRTVLPGSSGSRPFVPLSEIISHDPGETPEGPGRWIWVAASGSAPTRAAFSLASRLAAHWASDHPGAAAPIVVHITDGESSDGRLDEIVPALTESQPAPFLVNCLFRPGLPASTFTRAPETPIGDLWSMSSPLSHDPTPGTDPQPGHDPGRALLVNTRSAFLRIGEMVRKVWEAAVATPPAAPVIGPEEAISEAIPEPEAVTPAIPPEPEPTIPAGPPRFEARALWAPKRGNTEAQWEDGYAFDPAAGVVAVADGAGDGIFSKLWADLLLESYLARPVALDNPDAIGPWINERRIAWATKVDYPRQRWSVQLRLDQTCGAATFLGIAIGPAPEGEDGSTPWEAGAVGDVCLFHIREGRLVESFPVTRAAEFGSTPRLFQSKSLRQMPVGVVHRGGLLPGDRLVVATDATAQALLTEVEAGTPPDWGRFWDLDQETWRSEIETLRDRGAIVNDDCTLVVVRLPGDVTLSSPKVVEAEEAADVTPSEEPPVITAPTDNIFAESEPVAAPVSDELEPMGLPPGIFGETIEPEFSAFASDPVTSEDFASPKEAGLAKEEESPRERNPAKERPAHLEGGSPESS